MLADQSRSNYLLHFPWFRIVAVGIVSMVMAVSGGYAGILGEQFRLADENRLLIQENEALRAYIAGLEGGLVASKRNVDIIGQKYQSDHNDLLDCRAREQAAQRAADAKKASCFNIGDSAVKVQSALGPAVSATNELVEGGPRNGKLIRLLDYPNGGQIYIDSTGAYSYENMGHRVCR